MGKCLSVLPHIQAMKAQPADASYWERLTWMADYHHPTLLGLVSAMYSLGAIVALPFVPSVVDKFGRRHSILIGSLLMIIGGVLQGVALNRKQSITLEPQISSRTLS